jgi:phenylacetic acid degradation operon negative regulatory protein
LTAARPVGNAPVVTETTGADRAEGVPTRVLVLGMAHEDGTIVAAEVQPVADACGQSAEQVRSCLRRLVNEGLFTRDGAGQAAVFRATEAGLRALGTYTERTRLAYAQDAAGRSWDGRWHLVAFAVPEARRAARDAFRDHLLELGGAAVHNGLYVSPHHWDKDVAAEAQRLDITELVTLAETDALTIGGEHDARALAQRLWDVDRLGARYEAFVARWAHLPEALEDMRHRHERLDDAAFLPGALGIALEFQPMFADDPLLPPELLPRPWAGRAAREVLVRSRRLAMRIRTEAQRPALFRTYDDLLDRLP